MFLLRLIRAVVRALHAKRADLVAENLALRQQLIVLQRRTKRPRLKTTSCLVRHARSAQAERRVLVCDEEKGVRPDAQAPPPDAYNEVKQPSWVPASKKDREPGEDHGEELGACAPLFCNQSRKQISKRRVQFAWREWQKKAGFDRLYPFHCLRHSAVTAVYRATRDLFLAQRFARHASPLTTTAGAVAHDGLLKDVLLLNHDDAIVLKELTALSPDVFI